MFLLVQNILEIFPINTDFLRSYLEILFPTRIFMFREPLVICRLINLFSWNEVVQFFLYQLPSQLVCFYTHHVLKMLSLLFLHWYINLLAMRMLSLVWNFIFLSNFFPILKVTIKIHLKELYVRVRLWLCVYECISLNFYVCIFCMCICLCLYVCNHFC